MSKRLALIQSDDVMITRELAADSHYYRPTIKGKVFLILSTNLDPDQHAITAAFNTPASRSSALPETASSPSKSSYVKPHEDDQRYLPEGWERRMSKRGKIYYVDHNTRSTSWNLPTASTPSADPEKLPPGWEMRHTPEGRPYFVDHNNLTSTYDDPRQEPIPTRPTTPPPKY
jgi:hypothetical protein